MKMLFYIGLYQSSALGCLIESKLKIKIAKPINQWDALNLLREIGFKVNPNSLLQDSLEQVLNVDRTIWMHAINYSLINFDSYIGYAQNE